ISRPLTPALSRLLPPVRVSGFRVRRRRVENSQELEPPANPRRFIRRLRACPRSAAAGACAGMRRARSYTHQVDDFDHAVGDANAKLVIGGVTFEDDHTWRFAVLLRHRLLQLADAPDQRHALLQGDAGDANGIT